MTVSPVQNNKKNASYIKSGLIGGIAGYAAALLLPIGAQEKGDEFVSQLKKIDIESKGDTLKRIEGEDALKSATKRLRPLGTFIFTGLIVGLLIACIRNLRKDLSNEAQIKVKP